MGGGGSLAPHLDFLKFRTKLVFILASEVMGSRQPPRQNLEIFPSIYLILWKVTQWELVFLDMESLIKLILHVLGT